MSVKSEIIVKPAYVWLRCTGTLSSVLELKEVFQSAISAAHKSKKLKVLIDASGVKGQLSTLDRYEAASFLSSQTAQQALRIKAIALAGKEPLIDATRFGETVARNRGVNGRVFSDLDEAIEWLTSTE
jgi:hypothetical protein